MSHHKPEPDTEKLAALVEELTRIKALIGPLMSEGNQEPKGLAFIFQDMEQRELADILAKVDLTLPLSGENLETLTAIKEIYRENIRLRDLCVTDPLTGLFNRRHFFERFRIEVERVKRSEKPCSLIIIDLDGFKPVNDQHGHQAGDQLLAGVAELIRAGVRSVDVPVRYGGDEFAVILPDTSTEQARYIAERIRERIRTDVQTVGYGVTASLGIATCHYYDDESMESVIERADKAMYYAKEHGGNMVWFFETDRRRRVTTDITVDERDSLYFKLTEL